MELPEQDRQAFIDAARRRTQPQEGGAAFGVYPSSGKRPEKLNVSRDVNMPAQAGRGWVAGTLGLLRDIEGLGRMLINAAPAGQEHERVTGKSFVSETPFLPTSDFYREWLPGGDERPAAQFASGLGALAGGAGSTKVAGAAVKGAKATGKALGPKAAEMAEGYLQKSGLAPSVVKPKGGNWLSGSVEGATKPLVPTPGARGRPASETMREMEATYPPDVLQSMSPETSETVNRAFAALKPDVAVENWIDKKLNRYIKNEMGTPEDPVRKLIQERGVSHVPLETLREGAGWIPDEVARARKQAGFPELGMVEEQSGRVFGDLNDLQRAASGWETATDRLIGANKVEDLLRPDVISVDPVMGSWQGGDNPYLRENPWLSKVSPETSVYSLEGTGDLGFDHLIDELRNATSANSDLPANLRWKPEDLQKVTMEQAVERVAKINDWRAAQMEAARKAAREGIPLHKEYEGGFQWMAAPDTAIDPKSLQYIKDVGCEGGWCTQGEDLAKRYGGRGNQLYVLHDPDGKPVVQISVRPSRGQDKYYTDWVRSQPESVQDEITAAAIKYNAENPKLGYGESLNKILQDRIGPMPPEIIEIKGKLNAAPKEEHLPMVQDFVRSGQWSRVGDIQNTGMRATSSVFNDAELQRLRDAGETNIPYILSGEDIQRLHNLITPEGRRLKYDAKGNIVGSEEAGYAKGGLVQDTDAIVAQLKGMDKDKALTHALRMANAKQEAHMAAGGLAKLLKGAKKAEDVAKPAQIGNYQALPLKLPRAPNLPQQELTKTADRIARQQTGQHVRKSATEAQNLAGRSMKEVERLKKLDIQLQPTKDLPTPSVVPEELGQVRIALPGDISVADKILMSVDDLPIGSPQEGGPMYGLGKQDFEDPRFWASNEGPAQIFQNKVTDLSNLYETPEVLAQHMAMAHDAMNFAQHFADASLRAMQQMPVHPESAREFNKIIREGYEKINPRTKERVRIGFPTFPGVENYDEAYKALKADPEMRKWFNNRMKVEKITDPLGLPSGKQIEYAIMEPELRNMEHSMTGLSVGRMKPGASLIPGSEHATYSHDIAGQALGRTKELTPLELAFPDASAYIRQTQRPQDFTGTIQKVFPHQVVDEQYINQLGEYYNRLKQIRGYKKGGAVKKSGLSVLNKAII